MSSSVPASDPEEIAFALSLFVEIIEGNLTINPRRDRNDWLPESVSSESQLVRASPAERALDAIWEFYGSDPRRGDICARIAAFYLLMNRTNGEALAGWMIEPPEEPGETRLSSDVVEAIATIPLSRHIPYDEASFLGFLEQITSVEVCVQ